MWAKLVDEADAALAIAKTDELLAEQLHADRWAIRFRQFAGHEGRNPIPPHHVAHRRTRSYPGHQLVLFACQHRWFPFFEASAR